MEQTPNPFSRVERDQVSRDPIDIENWYDLLKDYTFPTSFIPITEEHAQAMLDYYDDSRHHSNKIINTERMKILTDLVDHSNRGYLFFRKIKFKNLLINQPKKRRS